MSEIQDIIATLKPLDDLIAEMRAEVKAHAARNAALWDRENEYQREQRAAGVDYPGSHRVDMATADCVNRAKESVAHYAAARVQAVRGRLFREAVERLPRADAGRPS